MTCRDCSFWQNFELWTHGTFDWVSYSDFQITQSDKTNKSHGEHSLFRKMERYTFDTHKIHQINIYNIDVIYLPQKNEYE